jgi:hypothetical protein
MKNKLKKDIIENINPEEKADELIRKFYTFGLNNTPFQSYSWYECKEQSLIAVDEIINTMKMFDPHNNSGLVGFWNNVKLHIEKL